MTPPTIPQTPPILALDGLPSTVWVNVWVHAAGNGPMRSVTLVNYDGNASTNALDPVASPFTLSLRCDHAADSSSGGQGALGCANLTNASITSSGARGGTTPLALRKTQLGAHTVLSVTVPGNTITAELGVVVFSAAGEWGFREARLREAVPTFTDGVFLNALPRAALRREIPFSGVMQ